MMSSTITTREALQPLLAGMVLDAVAFGGSGSSPPLTAESVLDALAYGGSGQSPGFVVSSISICIALSCGLPGCVAGLFASASTERVQFALYPVPLIQTTGGSTKKALRGRNFAPRSTARIRQQLIARAC